MPLAGHYVDPRLVALYDLENQRGADTDFYLGLARELRAEPPDHRCRAARVRRRRAKRRLAAREGSPCSMRRTAG